MSDTLEMIANASLLAIASAAVAPALPLSLPSFGAASNDRSGRPDSPEDVVGFWVAAGEGEWFAQRPAFDRLFRERFLAAHEAAARGDLAAWETTATGALALVLLLDQFPRNAFRATPRMYATDAAARRIAAEAIAAGHDRAVPDDLAVFFNLPFAHSEALADQERSVALAERLGEPSRSHSRRHRDIIARFGRFPHRNPILGRAMTPAEQAYLDSGGYRG